MITNIDPVDLHVGQRVRTRRLNLGLSQSHLATVAGITFQQVQKYERGANRISASRLVQFARALQVPVAWFFDGLGGQGGQAAPERSHDEQLRDVVAQQFDVAKMIDGLAELTPDARKLVVRQFTAILDMIGEIVRATGQGARLKAVVT